MTEAREIQVHMCAIGIGQGHDVLRATLGSCVGIGLLWRERAIYGLAHCLLPDFERGLHYGYQRNVPGRLRAGTGN
ncbi:hypothetical protein [Paraburkholderia phenazinium]|uniref:hypothetical protein n=1 Tax=Paraburkholderia phenazinium TaxID=60549 RepID=UPI00158E66E3|nr:hypothetical protein [Paraburkholderia phenazinium]